LSELWELTIAGQLNELHVKIARTLGEFA